MARQRILLTLLTLWSMHVSALEVAGVALPEQTQVEGIELVLNGVGIREKFFIDVYAMGLYLPAKTNSAAKIESAAMQKRVVMHFVHSEVPKKKLDSGWWTGFKENTTAKELTALRARLRTFQDMFGDMHAGDVVLIDMLPGMGTRVTINDQIKGMIEGDDFGVALIRIWVGPDPVGNTLKKGLLGS